MADDQFKARGGCLGTSGPLTFPASIFIFLVAVWTKGLGSLCKTTPYRNVCLARDETAETSPAIGHRFGNDAEPDWGVKIHAIFNFDIGPEDCLLFRCLDQDNDGTTDDIGTAATSLSELRARTKSSRPLLLINDNVKAFKSRKGEMYTDSGKIFTAFKADGYVTRLELYASECKLNNISLPKGQSDEGHLRGLYAKYRFDYKQP